MKTNTIPKTKALVLFSGGLDSRLAVKLLQDQGLDVEAIHFRLPFGGGCCNNFACVFNFTQVEGAKLHIMDCTKGELLQEYLEIIRSPKYGTGKAVNPCKDCKIFLFKKSKELADKINAKIIATGEVLGQRPMSQMKHALMFDEEKAGLKDKVLRPLSAKLLPETQYEKQGLIDRKKLLDISGRTRKKQMELAKKYKIKYPSPGGGCQLCEPRFAAKLKDLFDHKDNKDIKFQELQLLKGFRHFRSKDNKSKIILGKQEDENKLLEVVNKELKWGIIVPTTTPGPTVIYENKKDEKLAKDLQKAYSSKDVKKREKFDEFKIR